jgi:outer membrane protein assembly factor BamD
MRAKITVALWFPLVFSAGCSSVSVPSISMPSMPWSGSAAKGDPTAEALFEEGMRAFNDKKYVRAIDNFSKIRSDHPFSPLITQTELKMAEAYYFNQQYPEAINALKEFQALHPTNENIPLVVLRLGQSHFNQFTATDRDQKNTEIAKGYFESVIANYPKSPYAVEAREKLAKTLEYLAEHEFNVAHFYFQEEKYPAARDRFEEIVRKYKDTPTAVKSLFYLGESYRRERNAMRATLAYEALIQHYPQSKFAADAKTQLAQLEKEKHDPLAQLLMRDRRPGALAAPDVKEDPALARLRNLNLVEKKEVVYEEPGAEKSLISRVADKLNPFSSSSSSSKKDEPKEPTAVELLAKKNAAQKEQSPSLIASLWPFGGKDPKPAPAKNPPASNSQSNALVSQIDDTLKQRGIDSTARQAALNPPPADLPKSDPPVQSAPPTDTVALLSSIDNNLKRSGKNPNEVPAPPEAAAAFRDPAATQAAIAKSAQNQPAQDVQSSGILSSIDQKLRAQGVEPSRFERPPTAEEIKAAAAVQKPQQTKSVELEPNLALEKGPLFLNPTEVSQQQVVSSGQATTKPDVQADKLAESAKEPPNRILVKGPVQAQPATATGKPAEVRKPGSMPDDEPKGVFDQIRQDVDSIGKALNPFRW